MAKQEKVTNEIHSKYKYNLLIGTIRQKIFSGEFADGEKLPAERKIAISYGVARGTVRVALNQLSKEGLLEIRPNAGAFVTLPKAAVEEKTERKYLFGIILSEDILGISPEMNPFNAQILLGVFRARTPQDDFRIEYIIRKKKYVSLEENCQADNVNLGNYDGILAIAWHENTADLDYLLRSGVPFVLSGESGGPRFVPTVTFDNFSAMYQGVTHLASRGYKHTWFLSIANDFVWERRRRAGFIKGLKDSGLPFDEKQIRYFPIDEPKKSREFFLEHLRNGREFDSLIVLGDMQILAIIDALKAYHLRVPEDIPIVVFDNFVWLSPLIPHLPTIVQPFDEMGEAMVRMLIQRVRDPKAPVATMAIKPKMIL